MAQQQFPLFNPLSFATEKYTFFRQVSPKGVRLGPATTSTFPVSFDEPRVLALDVGATLLHQSVFKATYSRATKWAGDALTATTGRRPITAQVRKRRGAFSHLFGLTLSNITASIACEPLLITSRWKRLNPNLSELECWQRAVEANALWNGLGSSIACNCVEGISSVLLFDFFVWSLPHNAEEEFDKSTFNYRFLFSSFSRQTAEKTHLKQVFRRLMKNTFAKSIASWLGSLISYPLRTIQLRLQTQGAHALLPNKYNGMIDCARKIIDEEGWRALYNGFGAQVFSIVPELLLIGSAYFVFSLLIEFLYDASEQQTERSDQ